MRKVRRKAKAHKTIKLQLTSFNQMMKIILLQIKKKKKRKLQLAHKIATIVVLMDLYLKLK